VGKIQKPEKNTLAYLNMDDNYGEKVEKELADYFRRDKKNELQLKKNFRKIAEKKDDGNFG
jgi:hypothetical protein